MEIKKNLKDFPDGTEIQYEVRHKKTRYIQTGVINNGVIESSLGTFCVPTVFLDAIHKHVRGHNKAYATASGWKVIYYKKGDEWVSLKEFYNTEPVVQTPKKILKREPESYKEVNVVVETAEKPTISRVVEKTTPQVETAIQTEVEVHSKAVQTGHSKKPSGLPPDVQFVQEEPLQRASLIDQKTGAYALLHPKIVSLPFNIGWAWVDSMGHAWEAVPTDHPNVCSVGKYIGIYYEKEEYLALKILPSFPRIPPPEVRMFHTVEYRS